MIGFEPDYLAHPDSLDGQRGWASGRRYSGAVKWFNERKGFGFIRCDDGAELFFHHSELVMVGFKSINAGTRVSFAAKWNHKGWRALSITPETGGRFPEGRPRGDLDLRPVEKLSRLERPRRFDPRFPGSDDDF